MVKYKDYYQILGITRLATKIEIHKAYRRLARKYHPDLNKLPFAEEKFKEINEAYEVLRDPEKRRRYNSLGTQWKSGQNFGPPPHWKDKKTDSRRKTSEAKPPKDSKERSGFSDFFDTLFGGGFRNFRKKRDNGKHQKSGWKPLRGQDIYADLEISLEEAYHGATKSIEMRMQDIDPYGNIKLLNKRYVMKIPAGTRNGTRIRLGGQGGQGAGGGGNGDIFIRVHLTPHPVFDVLDHNVEMEVPVTPWEAALGSTIQVSTLNGPVTIWLPAGSSSGKRLRVRGKGLLMKNGKRGDQFVRVKIVLPQRISANEQNLYRKLKQVGEHNPRRKQQ